MASCGVYVAYDISPNTSKSPGVPGQKTDRRLGRCQMIGYIKWDKEGGQHKLVSYALGVSSDEVLNQER